MKGDKACIKNNLNAGAYVLFIELGGSGKRISEISEPLAEGKFSILYISTYQTDFVLISEPKLYQVMKALRQHGFDIESDDDSVDNDIEQDTIEEGDDPLSQNTQPLSPTVDPAQFLLDTSVLVNELQCVGLNKHYRSNWVQTVLKILCYPELVQSDCEDDYKRFCSFVATNEDISLIADTQIVATFEESSLMLEQDASAQRVIQVHFSGSNIERCGIVRSISKPLSMEANINMLYLSTFMTANIIVSADDLERAVHILSPQKNLLTC
ncbi:uncharacterized protein B0P05DRAFT_554408 [Gilbertella persicaria]|uniref:uncharacterized protein n=1 Tax=Gilbertella persicaria TaxID=101096 RepID=UPI00221F7725|nr:uncharacterized protein B0P05DRAFT_554408 [Gilbertella persicaria]KAI8064805.1 hypothetical protein B0P05DRAFT_554408 [Gilbertella persicaria]